MPGDAPTNVASPTLRVGSYRLTQSLGSGGMSSVYRGVHEESGHEVAVKILPRSLAKNPTVLQRFLREAKSAEALEHPNIVAIYDRGVDQGRHYIVLEYVAGGDLHDWLRANGPMPVADALKAVQEVVGGLSYAATRGLIHRDIKPANLLRTPEGLVKVADLGLALQSESEDERVTREGTTVGTVDYMSPEQARDSRATSIRSDIYSLGCTFYFLLTGQPPFAGGDVTDKLTRHCLAPRPDPRELRPEIPAELTTVLRKMMGRKPDDRYQDYASLSADLDRIARKLNGVTTPESPAPNGEIPLLSALVEEADEEDDFVPLTLAEPEPERAESYNLSMADLVALDDDEPIPVVRPEPRAGPIPRGSARPAAIEPEPLPGLFEEDGEDPDDSGEHFESAGLPGHVGHASSRPMTAEEKSWLTACILVGLSLVVLVIGLDQLLRYNGDGNALPTAMSEPDSSAGVVAAPDIPDTQPVAPPIVARPPQPEVKKAAEPPKPAVWVEPLDVLTAPAPERGLDPVVESRLVPDWARSEWPTRGSSRSIVVRRLAASNDADEKQDLRAALEATGEATVDIADDGPFFENDLLPAGEIRIIRARTGYRAIVCLERPKTDAPLKPSALVDLGGRSVVYERLDLIVDVASLPRTITSLFQCRGGSLTFRDCTITVVNAANAPFTVVQASSAAQPSRIRFDRTLVRGNVASVLDLATGPADILFSRSVLLNGKGAALNVSPAAADRRVAVIRSILATGGPVLTFGAPATAGRSRPTSVSAVASTFARLGSSQPTSLAFAAAADARPADLLGWRGDLNSFAGWSDWFSVGNDHTVRIAQLLAARAVWTGTDAGSEESSVPWTEPLAADRIVPDQIRALAANRVDVLDRVAVPSGFLHEKTVEPFGRVFVPALASELLPGAGAAPQPGPGGDPRSPKQAAMVAEAPNSAMRADRPAVDSASAGKSVRFDVTAAPWQGDLGRFLAETVKGGDEPIRVSVVGSGEHVFSPVRLPDGASVEVTVEPGQSPSWVSAPGASGEALISTRGGSVFLQGLRITRDGSDRLETLVRVERGHLVIHRCWLLAKGGVDPAGGNLVSFAAPGTQPLRAQTLAGSPWPFAAPIDRPVCRITDSVLVTGGDALSAEVGRGLIAFGQTAVAAGRTAFRLTPGVVAKARLDADLWIDHCTVAAATTYVTLGRWRGFEPGPGRPWLVTSQHTAFLDAFDRRSRDSVLLAAEPDAFAQGVLFWQSEDDAFEVARFAQAAGASPPAATQPDVRRQWVDLWGPRHVRDPLGPRAPHGTPSLRLLNRLQLDDLVPGDLVIDPNFPLGRRPTGIGADPARLGLALTGRPNRRR